MKKYILYTLLIPVVAGILFTSCEDMFGDFLDKQPSNELTEEIVFSDWTTTRQFHFDTYNFLRDGMARINGSWLDAATDISMTSFSYGGTRVAFNIGNYYTGYAGNELTFTWEHYYRGIRKCNMLLTRIDSVPRPADETKEKYETDKLNYKSEARFLRAFFFWELFLRYGPIPLVTEVLDPDGDLLSDYTTRPSIKEYVVDFVLNELKECEAGLMDYDTGKERNAGRITQPMARALYSRIMLYMAGDRFRAESGITWKAAADASKSFIDDYGKHYGLFQPENNAAANYTAAILRNAHNEKNTETIFWRNDLRYGWGAIEVDSPVGEGGMGGNCPTQNLVDMYDMANGESPFNAYDETGAPVYNNLTPSINPLSGYNDANPYADRDPRFSATVLYHGVNWGNGVINVIRGQRDNPSGNTNATPTGYYMRKYIPENILSNNHSGTSYMNWIIIRYAEILLNYAEALHESGGSREEVLNTLQPIRDRAGLTAKLTDRADLNTASQIRNFIRKERTVELAFEEHRVWDVRRWNVAEKALARPIYGIEVTREGDRVVYTRKLSQNRVFEPKMYLYPIPEAEVWKTNIENNPGW